MYLYLKYSLPSVSEKSNFECKHYKYDLIKTAEFYQEDEIVNIEHNSYDLLWENPLWVKLELASGKCCLLYKAAAWIFHSHFMQNSDHYCFSLLEYTDDFYEFYE